MYATEESIFVLLRTLTFASAKIVRGAYMTEERARSLEKGYPSPILDNIQEVAKNFNECVEVFFRSLFRCSFGVFDDEVSMDPSSGGVVACSFLHGC